MSLLDQERIEALKEYCKLANEMEGDIVEVGVYKGGSANILCLHSPQKHVFLFDTFIGLPPTKPIDEHKEGDFSDTSIAEVMETLKPSENYSIHQGVFPRQGTEHTAGRKFCLVHLDVDIFDSVMECLEYFYPRMVPGGMIVIDDYNAPMCVGARLAVDKFLIDKPERIERHVSCSVMFRKK